MRATIDEIRERLSLCDGDCVRPDCHKAFRDFARAVANPPKRVEAAVEAKTRRQGKINTYAENETIADWFSSLFLAPGDI